MEYKASLDTLSKILTVGVILLLTVIGIRIVLSLSDFNGDATPMLISIGVLVLFFAIIIGSYAFSITGYTVTQESLIIRRRFNNITIPRADIEEVRTIGPGEMKSLIRTFGNGGLFGYYGKFYSSTFGHMTFYVTNIKNKVLIRTTSGKKIIISPDDRQLVNELIQ